MSLRKVPLEAGAKQIVSLKQGVQVTMATHRAAATTRHCHTEKVSGDTC